MIVEVQCYAGRKADERPVRFRIDARDFIVEEIVEQWYGPQDRFFRVRADDGNVHLLCQDVSAGTWRIETVQKLL